MALVGSSRAGEVTLSDPIRYGRGSGDAAKMRRYDAVKPSWKKGIKRSKIQEEFVFLQGISPSKYNFQCVRPRLGAMVRCRGMGRILQPPQGHAQHKVRRGLL